MSETGDAAAENAEELREDEVTEADALNDRVEEDEDGGEPEAA